VSQENRPGAVADLAALYLDTIRRHAAEPVGYAQAIDPTHEFEADNPLCGDRILMQLRLTGETLEAAAFDGQACAICLASASLLCELAPGTSLARFHALREALVSALTEPDRDAADLEEALRPLLGVRPYPSRIRCATLPWTAARRALEAPASD
jgi:nitrogen fixation NifU-like protein